MAPQRRPRSRILAVYGQSARPPWLSMVGRRQRHRMKPLLMMLLGVAGIVCGQLLYRLPFWLFFRHAAWLTAEELRAAFPEKGWVSRTATALIVAGFVLLAPLLFSTDVTREVNWF